MPSPILIVLLPFVALVPSLALFVVRRRIQAPPRESIWRREPFVDVPAEARDEPFGESCGDWTWAADARLRLHGDLRRFGAAAGLSPARLDGMALKAVLDHGPGAAALRAALDSRASFRDLVVEARRADGTMGWWRLAGTPVQDDRGRFIGYRGHGADLTALRQAQARIAFLVTHDPLTGLANRDSFQQAAARACAAAAAGGPTQAVLMLDLDSFKRVNDNLGHAVGDELLVAVASILTRAVPASAMVARLGGDEFAILYAPGTAAAAEALAVALATAIGKPLRLAATTARTAVSIGLAFAPQHAIDGCDLARKADLALLRAKSAKGAKPLVFEERFERELDERLRLEADLTLALQRNELGLNYQPLLDVAAGEIGACEALLRWHSPTRGTVSPDAFIAIAETTGLIVAIGRFVLRQACRDAAAWPHPARVAVNISPQHLREPEFKTDVMEALRAGGLPPSRLEIEITEGIVLERSRASLDTLVWLRERGIKVVLDDFGTGFSSLSYLLSFPVDKIKIDRSFIAGLPDDPKSGAVVDAILTLARALAIRVVAEGVETAEQALALKLRRCHELQGFLICRPQRADDIGLLFATLQAALRREVPGLLESSLAAALAMKRSA